MDNATGAHLIVYGHNFCGQSRSLRHTLDENHVDYEWRDVREGPAEYQEQLKKMAHGSLSVPTVVFPDGSFLVEPYPDAVLEKLKPVEPSRPSKPSLLARLFGR